VRDASGRLIHAGRRGRAQASRRRRGCWQMRCAIWGSVYCAREPGGSQGRVSCARCCYPARNPTGAPRRKPCCMWPHGWNTLCGRSAPALEAGTWVGATAFRIRRWRIRATVLASIAAWIEGIGHVWLAPCGSDILCWTCRARCVARLRRRGAVDDRVTKRLKR